MAVLSGTGPVRHHYFAGISVLTAGILAFAAAVFGITAGVGAIWTAVAGNGNSNAVAAAPAAATANVKHVSLVVDPPPLYGVKVAGAVHDAFVPGTFTMEADTTVVVSVTNYDAMPHTWTSASLGVNALVPPGSQSSPSHMTFTIHPKKAGTFTWKCTTPCDPWSMAHVGYMEGVVTVTA